MGRGFWRWVTKRFLFKLGAEWKCPIGSYFFLQLVFCSCMHNLDLKINGSKMTKTWGKQACNSNMLPDPELRKFSFINFGAMKGFNFSRFGKVQRQQHQEELAAQQVKYMHQHLGSSRYGKFIFTHQNIKTSSEPFGVLQVFACFFKDVYLHTIHIAYVLWLVSSIQNQNMFFRLFWGVWFVRGQTLDMSRSPNHLGGIGVWDEGKSFSIKRRTFVRGTRLVVVAGIFPYDFSTIISVII